MTMSEADGGLMSYTLRHGELRPLILTFCPRGLPMFTVRVLANAAGRGPVVWALGNYDTCTHVGGEAVASPAKPSIVAGHFPTSPTPSAKPRGTEIRPPADRLS
jgi:hypothetical protein